MMITGSRVDYAFTPPTILEQKEIIKQYYSPFEILKYGKFYLIAI